MRGETLVREFDLRPDIPYPSLDRLLVHWNYPVELGGIETAGERLEFVFERRIGSIIARLDSTSLALAEQLEDVLPQIYIPRTITAVAPYAHQLARFRGAAPHLTNIEVYARPPLRTLGVGRSGSVEVGMFLFDDAWYLRWHDKRHNVVRDSVLGVSYKLEVRRRRASTAARHAAPSSRTERW